METLQNNTAIKSYLAEQQNNKRRKLEETTTTTTSSTRFSLSENAPLSFEEKIKKCVATINTLIKTDPASKLFDTFFDKLLNKSGFPVDEHKRLLQHVLEQSKQSKFSEAISKKINEVLQKLEPELVSLHLGMS